MSRLRLGGYGLNRYLCDVLEDMRKCNETRNFAPLMSLIEEAQILGRRMEAALEDVADLESLHDKIKEAKKELTKLSE